MVMAMLFLTPPLTRLLALPIRRVARRCSATGVTLALDNLLRWPKRYGLVVATLACGIALLAQTGGIIRSNEEALRDWLDRSVIGDLFVTSGGPLSASGQNQPMSDDLAAAWSRRIPGLRIVPMRFRYVDWQQGDRAARLLVVLLDAPAYRAAIDERYTHLPDRDLYRRLSEQPDAALVSRNFAARNGLTAGDRLTLPTPEGPRTFRILGTVADYSCMQGTVLLDRRRHARAFGANLADVFSVTVPAGVDIEWARSECLNESTTSLTIVTHQEMRAHTLGMIQRLYGIAAAQLALVAVVSLFGVAATMAISVLQRSNELRLFRCIGATRSQIIGLVLAEAFMIGLLGSAAGLLLGSLLEWFTVRVVLFAETGFVFRVVVPWRELLTIGLAAPVCATLASLIPALTAARMNPAGGFATE
jgi:putative ABC transport system permease protein